MLRTKEVNKATNTLGGQMASIGENISTSACIGVSGCFMYVQSLFSVTTVEPQQRKKTFHCSSVYPPSVLLDKVCGLPIT